MVCLTLNPLFQTEQLSNLQAAYININQNLCETRHSTMGKGTLAKTLPMNTVERSRKQDVQDSPGCKMSDSGKSSKFEVSSILLISMEIAAGLSLQEPERRVRQGSLTFCHVPSTCTSGFGCSSLPQWSSLMAFHKDSAQDSFTSNDYYAYFTPQFRTPNCNCKPVSLLQHLC